jgi:hypothetical protein
MPAAMTALATITLGSAQSTVTFSSIPATYRDLRVVITRLSNTNANIYPNRINGDAGGNYSYVGMGGTGSSANSSSGSSNNSVNLELNTFSTTTLEVVTTIDYLDYSATDKHKTVLSRNNNGGTSGGGTDAIANRWASTAAITSLSFSMNTNTFSAGSVFSLYGILA